MHWIPSRQLSTSGTQSWTEAIFFRRVLHRSWAGTRVFRLVNNNVQLVRAAWHDGGGGEQPTPTGSGHHGWSMVPSQQQRPTNGTEAIFFREVLHRSLRGARSPLQHVHERSGGSGGGSGGGGGSGSGRGGGRESKREGWTKKKKNIVVVVVVSECGIHITRHRTFTTTTSSPTGGGRHFNAHFFFFSFFHRLHARRRI